MDELRTPFSPGSHGDREERSRKKGEPASLFDLKEIGSKVGYIKTRKTAIRGTANQRDHLQTRVITIRYKTDVMSWFR